MAGWNDAIDEARSALGGIINLLGEQNKILTSIANKPPPVKKNTKFNVISEAQLRTVSTAAGVKTLVFPSELGVYKKLNHWTVEYAESSHGSLYYGMDASNAVILDSPKTGEATIITGADPNELIVPPQMNIYFLGEKSAIITLSVTTYELSQ
jgi:streptogramin lyase